MLCSLLLLSLNRNLIDALLVATAFEGGLEELIHNLTGGIVVDEASGHYEHVGIVVLTNEVGDFGAPCQSGTHALMLVERDGDAFARAANADARIYLAALDALGQGMAEVRIVDAGIAPRAIVLIGIAFLLEILKHELLQRITCMVAGYAYGFYFHIVTVLMILLCQKFLHLLVDVLSGVAQLLVEHLVGS